MHVRRSIKLTVLFALTFAFLGFCEDQLHLNPAQEVAFSHGYDLVEWEARNFLAKWVHRVASALPWNSLSFDERLEEVHRHFGLSEELARLRTRLAREAAEIDGASQPLSMQLERVESDRAALRNSVEETLESSISQVLATEELSSFGGFIWPPVDVRMTRPPKVLVTSPRDRIFRQHDALLEPDVSLQSTEELEAELTATHDLSGLVVEIGGVATYPASIVDTLPLRSTLRLAAHEWLHNFLFFRPLGFNIFDSPEMQTLNETFADIAGREIGDRAYELLGGTVDQPMPPTTGSPAAMPEKEDEAEDQFDFAAEMRETRQRADELLDAGSIEEAEAYMEERRRLFVDQGFPIRKLNQAYFAFYGTYAESPTSVSPTGSQLRAFRDLVPTLHAFITEMARFSTYEQFLVRLEELEAGAEPS